MTTAMKCAPAAEMIEADLNSRGIEVDPDTRKEMLAAWQKIIDADAHRRIAAAAKAYAAGRLTDPQIDAWREVALAASGQKDWLFGPSQPDGRAYMLETYDKAPPGPVHTVHMQAATEGESLIVAITGNGPTSEANAKHIAWASPSNILCMLEELAELRAERMTGSERAQSDRADAAELFAKQLRYRITVLKAEQAKTLDFAAFADDKSAWSLETFGPRHGAAGVLDHIRKELAEVEREPGDLAEWVDIILLAMDGARRCAGADGATLAAALVAKMAKNKARTWPDWRTAAPGKAIEHDRSGDAITDAPVRVEAAFQAMRLPRPGWVTDPVSCTHKLVIGDLTLRVGDGWTVRRTADRGPAIQSSGDAPRPALASGPEWGGQGMIAAEDAADDIILAEASAPAAKP